MSASRRRELPPCDAHDTFSVPLWGGKRLRARRKLKPQGIIGLAAILFLALRSVLWRDRRRDERLIQQLSLYHFPTMAYPLAHAKLVLLYFGASYFDENRFLRDCFFRDERLLPQEGLPISGPYDMAIVYVSSDEEEGSSEWIHVVDTAERNALRRKFQVGSTLQEAKFTVPSLFVIDSASHGVMTPMGLIDLKEKGSEALEGWLQFQNSIQDLDPKVWADSELINNEEDTILLRRGGH
jgi:hypothetical protein